VVAFRRGLDVEAFRRAADDGKPVLFEISGLPTSSMRL
jgi:hypothetical protein